MVGDDMGMNNDNNDTITNARIACGIMVMMLERGVLTDSPSGERILVIDNDSMGRIIHDARDLCMRNPGSPDDAQSSAAMNNFTEIFTIVMSKCESKTHYDGRTVYRADMLMDACRTLVDTVRSGSHAGTC